MANSEMSDLSIIIPFRFSDQRRKSIFDWIHNRYNLLYPESRIIVADSDENKPFNRSQARNYGVDNTNTKYILLADADTISFRPFVAKAIELLDSNKANWVIPYGVSGYYALRKPYSNKVLALPPDIFITPDKFEWKHQFETSAGQIVIKTESFYEANGYDERFKGWGYEDNAFQNSVDTIVGPFSRIESGWTAHVWHSEPEHERFQQPNIEHNQSLMRTYSKANGKRDEMIKVVERNRLDD